MDSVHGQSEGDGARDCARGSGDLHSVLGWRNRGLERLLTVSYSAAPKRIFGQNQEAQYLHSLALTFFSGPAKRHNNDSNQAQGQECQQRRTLMGSLLRLGGRPRRRRSRRNRYGRADRVRSIHQHRIGRDQATHRSGDSVTAEIHRTAKPSLRRQSKIVGCAPASSNRGGRSAAR